MNRLLALLLVLVAATPAMAAKKPPYTYYRVGNSSNVNPVTTPGVVLMGGGNDAVEAFRWLCSRAGNGDILVIRATGTDSYNADIRTMCPDASSVATLVIPSVTAANDPEVARIMGEAEAIWIAGGDQSNYVNFWTGTLVQGALNSKLGRAPVGGTSAGMDVLSQFIYSAQASQGVSSSQALADPYNRYMSFARDFVAVPKLQGVLADAHFSVRDRMGRNLAFLCRVANDYGVVAPRGIAVDEQTALMMDGTGNAAVTGVGNVYFLQAPAGPPQVCAPKTPLTYRNISVQRLGNGGSFDLNAWSTAGGTSYSVSAEAGVLSSTQQGGSVY